MPRRDEADASSSTAAMNSASLFGSRRTSAVLLEPPPPDLGDRRRAEAVAREPFDRGIEQREAGACALRRDVELRQRARQVVSRSASMPHACCHRDGMRPVRSAPASNSARATGRSARCGGRLRWVSP